MILSAAALNQDDTATQLDLAFSNARHGTLIIQECQDLNGLSQRRILETLKKTKQRHAPRLIFTADGALFDGVKSGAFLEELFYRITLSTLRIKPLRERPEDLLTLVQSEIRRFAALYGRHDMGLTDEAKALIIDAPWAHERRNRQFVLRTLIEPSKSALLTSEDVTDCTMMLPIARRQSTAELSLVNESGLMRPLAEIERDVIEFALEKSGGRIADVAQELGIGRSTLYRKLEAHGRFVDEKNSLIIGDAA